MARHRITKKLEENIKPEQVFDASQAAFNELGWEVYKTRAIAYLVEARKTIDNDYILANIITSAYGTPEVIVTLISETASETTVEAQANNILAALEKVMGNL